MLDRVHVTLLFYINVLHIKLGLVILYGQDQNGNSLFLTSSKIGLAEIPTQGF